MTTCTTSIRSRSPAQQRKLPRSWQVPWTQQCFSQNFSGGSVALDRPFAATGARILSQQSRNWPVIRREPGRSSASARTAAVVPWHCFRRSCCHRSASARQSKGLASRGLQVAFEVAADGAAAAVDHLAASIVSSPTVTPRSIPSPAPASASETVPLVNTWAELDLMRPA